MATATMTDTVTLTKNQNIVIDKIVQDLTDEQLLKLRAAYTRLDELYDPTNTSAAVQKLRGGFQPSDLRAAFRKQIKSDDPDTLLVRFLRFTYWNVDKGLEAMIKTLAWRRDKGVDDKIIPGGDARFAHMEQHGTTEAERKYGNQVLAQMRGSKAFLRGTDRTGRPVVFVRARYHSSKAQSIEALEEFIIYAVEMVRMTLRPPYTGVTAVLDLKGFTMANMDWAILKLGLSGLLQMYPEALERVYICHAPWIVNGIWATVKRWLQPELVERVFFLSKYDDLAPHFDMARLPADMGGSTGWSYEYVEPRGGPGPMVDDPELKASVLKEREGLLDEHDRLTKGMKGKDVADLRATMKARQEVVSLLQLNYWRLDGLVRGETYLDRVGVIGKDGSYHPWI